MLMDNNSLFGGATLHSPGEVAAAGAGVRGTSKRLANELNICMLFEKANKCIKKYERSRGSSKGHKRHPEQLSRAQYQGSQGDKSTTSDLTGARVHSQPKGIREHTTGLRSITHQSTGVRDHTITLSEDTNLFSGRAHSILCVGPSHSAPLPNSGQSTLDPVDSEGYNPNGRDHLSVQSVVMCDISKKYRFRNNFVNIVIISIFDTALADFDIYRKGNILQ